jgi:hypothetical protein
MPDTPQVIENAPKDAPIVCTIRPDDDPEEWMRQYRTLFADDAYLTRERTASGVRWTFRNDDGIEPRVRALAAIEQRCCAFLRITVSVADGQVHWDLVGPADAQPFLDEYFQTPETVRGSTQDLQDRVTLAGLTIDDQRTLTRRVGRT